MRGGGHSNYVQDQAKRDQWAQEIADHTEISPEQLLGFFSPEWVRATDCHQQKLGELSVADLIERPTPQPKSEDEARFVEFAGNNVGIYDDDIEDQLDEDPLLSALQQVRERYTGDEAFSRLNRIRRTVVTYILLSAEEDHSAA